MTALQSLLGCTLPPIGIAFVDEPPQGVARSVAAPASCGYWRAAAEGRVFYTDATDHVGCPVGAHTHNVPLTPEKSAELSSLVDTMVGLEYLAAEEVASIPQRTTPFRFAVYGPAASLPVRADLILVRGTTAQLMRLTEAAQAAGVLGSGPVLGRPTCVVLPVAMNSGKASMSLGCVGNRVYTGLEDGEGYIAIPASALDAVMERLPAIARANEELLKFHRQRAATH